MLCFWDLEKPELALCVFGIREGSSDSDPELELEPESSTACLVGLVGVGLPERGTDIGVGGFEITGARCVADPPLKRLNPRFERLERRGM